MCHVSDCGSVYLRIRMSGRGLCVRSWLGVLENKDEWAGPMCHVSDCGWLYLRIRMSGRGLCVRSWLGVLEIMMSGRGLCAGCT